MTPDDVWYSRAPLARLARGALLPASALFRAGATVRAALYDRGVFRVVPSPIPTVSVGNLTVGGTGKTPVAAELVRRLEARGAGVALVTRGYGGDEPLVHALLNPAARVYASPDRVGSIARAAREGVDVAVLDDGFQHRRAARDADVVLVSAEWWDANARVLPAGPYREPLAALRRATLVAVTRKSATAERAAEVARIIRERTGGRVPTTVLHLRPDHLRLVHTSDAPDAAEVRDVRVMADTPGARVAPGSTHDALPLAALAGARVLAVAGVGDPSSFFAQLRAAGAIVESRSYGDHHAYTDVDVADLRHAATGHKYVLTTLKDAVKLRARWPAKGAALWYVSQAVDEDGGESRLDALIDELLPH